MPHLRQTGRAAAWLATATLLVVACNPDATAPTSRLTPSMLVAPDDPPPPGGVLGPIPIPIPETNLHSGNVPWMGTGMVIPANTSFIVTVSGTVDLAPNPKVAECWPDHRPPYGAEGSRGPLGDSWYQLAVGIGFQYQLNGALGWIYGGIRGDGGSTASSDTASVDKDVELWVSRSGVYHEIGGGGPCPPQGFYLMSGSQTVSVQLLDGVVLDVDPKMAMVKKGTKVEFTATAGGVKVGQPAWRFIPAPGTENATTGCSDSSNPCTLTINTPGELRVSKFLQGRMRSARAGVAIYSDFSLTADKSAIDSGETVVFTPIVDGAPGAAAKWVWRNASGTSVANPCAKILGGKCSYAPAKSGTMWAFTSTTAGGDSASASVTVRVKEDDEPLTIEMLDAEYPLADKSFTTLANERVITLHARTSKPARDADIEWEVIDDPNDHVESFVGVGSAKAGPNTTLEAHAWEDPTLEGTPRWRALHSCPDGQVKEVCSANHNPVSLDYKAISYSVVAFVMDKGKRIETKPLIVKQNVVDVLRQEYIDFDHSDQIPSRETLLATRGSTYFAVSELLGNSDYAATTPKLGWLEPQLLNGLDNVRTYYGKPVRVNAGYRNPVHNWVHVGLDQHYTASRTSNHMFGFASDLFTGKQKEVFYELSTAGALAGACMEPPDVFFTKVLHVSRGSLITDWDHVHVDWIPGANACNSEWKQWGDSLLPKPK
jgi:hypothetical protein